MKHVISVLQCPCDSVTVCLTKMYMLLVFTTLLLRCNVADLKSIQKQEERGSASMDGDFIFGALYSVHHQPKSKRTDLNNILKCGDVRELYGIQRIEVTFQTLEAINRDPNILPNITLGVEIRDSCWYAPVALQQSIELIRDSISPNMINEDDICPAAQPENEPQPNAEIPTEGEASSAALWRRRPLIGVIGPGSSSVALQVQNLLQLFHIPQIGYSTTSKDLSDKSRFNYFQRVVPSDYYQAQVMVDVVRRFNWTYVSAVNTDENYGQSGIQAFRELAERADVCIAREDSVLSNADDEAFEDVIINLQQDASARVVVCFCEGLTVRGLLAAVQRRNLTGRFLFIGSDGWADRSDVTEKYEPVAHGSLSIRIHSPYVKSFDAYYFGLRPETNVRNPWFKEFWQVRFGCKFPDEPSHPDDGASVGMAGTQLPIISDDHGTETVTDVWPEITSTSDDRKPCTGEEDLSEGYKQDPKLSFVIKAIYTLAYGLHSMQQDVCGTAAAGLCPRLYPFNGSLFKSYLMNVSFTYEDGDAIEFDTRGDPPGRYDIMNYQLLKNGTYDYVQDALCITQVGDWNNGTLSFTSDIQFGAEPGIRESVCSRPCEPGSRKTFQVGGQDKRCCWVCQQCGSDERLFNETYCDKCPLGTLPDLTKTYCYEIPIEFVKWSDTQAIVAIAFSCLGFLTTVFSLSVFVRYNNTPVVKSSTRELSYLILAGMTLSHAATFPILSKPSQASCSLSRTLPGISFAMIYASLLVKTNRIARILAGSKKRFPSRKLRFMSATSQVLITCCLISLEVGFSIAMLVYEPAASTVVYPSRDRAALVCNTTPTGVVAPLAFDFFLIALCTVYALKTRNVPENFNEAKFIGFAMYTTCVIWIAFVPIYFGSETKIITMCMCVTLSAMVTFAFLFLPKLYIILLRPERNNRALFTTSKSIRCHIGTRVASAVSEKSSFTSSLGYQDSTHWKGDLYSEMPTVGLIASSDVAAAVTTKNVNWKDRPDRLKSSFNQEHRKPERRTLSCQTGDELLQLLLDSRQCKSPKDDQKLTYCPSPVIKDDLPEWAELNPKTLMNQADGYSPIIKYRSPKQDQRSPKLTISKLTTSKARIREESASDCSLSDNDSCQLKNITINIGSITSIHTINRTTNNGAVTPTVNRKRSVTPSSWNHVNHNRSINSSPTHSLA